MKTKTIATIFAFLAAALYAMSIPLSKLLLAQIPPTMMAAFLYLGAGIGLFIYGLFKKANEQSERLAGKDFPYIIGVIVLDILAPILLMLGLMYTNSSNAALLSNFEIVATTLIAHCFFREILSKKLVFAIILISLASLILSFDGSSSFLFSIGSVLILLATCCWGLENNLTRLLSSKSSVQITTIKGLFSGLGSLLVAFIAGEKLPHILQIIMILLLGFVAYGLSINFYIKAQKHLGAAKTSAYYSFTPFLGVVFSLLILGEIPHFQFYIGLLIMVVATIMIIRDSISLQHTHEHSHIHSHEHMHSTFVHSHEHAHVHSHTHIHMDDEDSHNHTHQGFEDHQHVHVFNPYTKQ